MKKLLILSIIVFFSNCSGKYFSVKENMTIPNNYKIYVGKVSVNLKEEKLFSDSGRTQKYPNQEELSKIFRDEIVLQMKQEGLYSSEKNDKDVFESDFDINYVRVFMAFTSDKYAGARLEGYKISVTKEGDIIATRNDTTRYATNQGLIGNLTKIGRTLSLSADASDELKEVKIFAHEIAKDLKHLRE